MKPLCALCFILLCGHAALAQHIPSLGSRDPGNADNIAVERLAGDSLTTSFLIAVKNKVPTHYHEAHSEHVYVLEGNGRMWLGGDTLMIAPGDYVFIPVQTPHGVEVTGDGLLKVLSIQSPDFDGTDRVVVVE